MLSASAVTFRAAGRALIDNLSANFEPGLLHLIIGPNGAGKSTLVKLLARVLRPHAGHVKFAERDEASWSERDLAKRRAILSQAIEASFPIPVYELVMMGRYPHFGGRPSPTDDRICEEVMRYFEVTEFSDRSYYTLSGGERQRVNFARVLAQVWERVPDSCRYLFLDEPLTFLDIHHQIDLMQKVRAFASQRDVVTIGVVHDLNLAAQFADRLILLNHGRILAHGEKAEVLTAQHLHEAFRVTPVLLENPVTGQVYLAFN